MLFVSNIQTDDGTDGKRTDASVSVLRRAWVGVHRVCEHMSVYTMFIALVTSFLSVAS